MKPVVTIRAILLSLAMPLVLIGCSGDSNEMSQEEIQYISHLDQSRFFQRQGELKASTREARSAIEMQPGRPDPYLIILDNLLIAGDARNAERQLETFLESTPDEAMTQSLNNRAQLIMAESNLMQGDFESALTALDTIESPDRSMEQESALLRGRIMLASGQPERARAAFEEADRVAASADAQVGLSRVGRQLGDSGAVQDHLARAEEIDPNSPELWLWKARLAEESEDWAEAEEAYIQALEYIGRYDIMTFRKYETMSALIRALREQGKSSEAFVYEEILAKSAPGTIKSNLTAAQTAYENGEFDEAARYLEEIIAQAPGNEQASLMMGLVRFRQGRIEEAENLLAPVAELGESELASKLVAASRLQLRDPEGAQQILKNLDSADTDPSVLAMVGIASLSTGNVEAGESLIEKSLALSPENDNLRARYIRYLLASNQPEKAFEQIELLRGSDNNSALIRPLQIQAHLASDNPAEAKKIADQWLEDSPQELDALMTRGQISAQQEDYQDAIGFFERAEQSHNDQPAPKVALGRIAMAREKPEIARQHFAEASMLAPDNMQALQGMAATHSREELKSSMEQLVDQHPTATAPRLILLEIALNQGNQTAADELSAALLERESADNPTRAEPAVANIYNGVGTRLRRNGRADEAMKVLERGRVLFPENENIALQSAALAFDEGEAEKARRILQDVKRVHDQSANPYLVEAEYFSDQEQHQQAAELYRLAIEKGAGADASLALARSLERAGRAEEAIETLEDALEENPEHQGLLVSTALFHQRSGNNSEATKAYEQVLAAFPQNALALNNLAWIYFEQGDERAGELSEQAYELSPQNAAIADTHGWILFKSGNTEASLPILEKAYELAPESQEIGLHLAEAYREVGRNSDARRLLEKFSEAESD